MKEKKRPIINNNISNNDNQIINNIKIEDPSESKTAKRKSKIHEQLGYKLNLQNKDNEYDQIDEEDDEEYGSVSYDIGKNIYRYNIILVGDSSVGKTSIINRFIENRFNMNIKATINIEFKIKSIKLDSNTIVDLKIWDTCGEERFHSITKNFYHSADGIFIVFDLGNMKSFSNIKLFLDDINEICDIKTKSIMIIGNKNDLPIEEKIIKEKDIKKIMDINKEMKYLDVSARSGDNIEDMFITMSKLIIDQKSKIIENEDENKDNNSQNKKIIISNSSVKDIKSNSREKHKEKCC